MDHAQAVTLVRELAPTVRRFVEDAVRPLAERLAALEARPAHVAKDGVGVAAVFHDTDGCMILTLTDGRTLNAGKSVREEVVATAPDLSLVVDAVASLSSTICESIVKMQDRIENLATAQQEATIAKNTEELHSELDVLVKEHVSVAVAALPIPKDGKDGLNGKDSSAEDVAQILKGQVEESVKEHCGTLVAAIPHPKDGKDVDEERVERFIEEKIAEAAEKLPKPEKGDTGESGKTGEPGPAGKDADPDVVTRLVDTKVAEAVAKLPPPEKGDRGEAGVGEPGPAGKDADPEVTAQLIDTKLAEAVAKLPPPINGKDGERGERGEIGPVGKVGPAGKDADVEAINKTIATKVSDAVAKIPIPKDGAPGASGVGAASSIINRAGHLIITLSDGTAQDLGPVIGRDGKDGLNASEFAPEIDYDGERTIIVRLRHGDKVAEAKLVLPNMIYRHIFKEGQTYLRGDCVTWGGSLWHANEDTMDKPGEGSKAWTLVAKRGRDGKDGRDLTPTTNVPIK